MMISSGKEVAFNQAVLYALARLESQEWCWRMNKCWQPIILRHCYQKYLSQASWEIFQLTLNSPTVMSYIHFRKAEMIQQSCRHCTLLTMFYTRASCIFTEYFSSLHFTLSLHFTINFTESIMEFFMHAQTVRTRCSLRFFECLRMRLLI